MLPSELEVIFNEYSEDDFNLCVTKVDCILDKFIVEFRLSIPELNDQNQTIQKWTINARDQVKNKIYFDFEDTIVIKTDHPLLWEFYDVQCQLYYSGKCNDEPKLFYDLYNTHKSIFGDYKCFNISFGADRNSVKPFQFENGLITEGSKKLMLKYAECLKKNGLEYTIIGERPAKYWNGSEFIAYSENLKILLFGKSYIIANNFDFTRQQESSI